MLGARAAGWDGLAFAFICHPSPSGVVQQNTGRSHDTGTTQADLPPTRTSRCAREGAATGSVGAAVGARAALGMVGAASLGGSFSAHITVPNWNARAHTLSLSKLRNVTMF